MPDLNLEKGEKVNSPVCKMPGMASHLIYKHIIPWTNSCVRRKSCLGMRNSKSSFIILIICLQKGGTGMETLWPCLLVMLSQKSALAQKCSRNECRDLSILTSCESTRSRITAGFFIIIILPTFIFLVFVNSLFFIRLQWHLFGCFPHSSIHSTISYLIPLFLINFHLLKRDL